MKCRVALLSSCLLLASAAHGQLMPGDIFVSDFGAGAVHEISAGGDFSAVTPFASGLNNPQDLCVGPNGDLYVSEQFDDEVTIITTGVAVAHATSLDAPMGLLCTDTQVLVVEFDTGEVTDITAAGDYFGAGAFAIGLTAPVGLLRDSNGTLWVTENSAGEITNITAGGDFTAAAAFATNQTGIMGMAEFAGDLLVAAFTPNTVIDFSAGGDLTLQPVVASVDNVTQIEDVDGALLAVSADDEIVYDITTGTPSIFAFGFSNLNPTGGIAHVPSGFCGDGTTDAGEECDDGNTVDGDGCDASCTSEVCGNGVVQAGEECDDGNTILGDGCDTNCVIEVCGNNVVQFGEECDDGNTVGGDGCSAICENESCGDGVQQPSEDCDDGNTFNGDGCDATCNLEVCGNGILQLGEECDDGNTFDGDGCSSSCVSEICGDGILQGGEECDDSNTTDGDGCSSACRFEVCGDGIVQPPELCDDGNTLDGDTCSGDCMEIPEPSGPLMLVIGALVLLLVRASARPRRRV